MKAHHRTPRQLTPRRLAESAGLLRTVFAASLAAGLAFPAGARGPEGAQVVSGSAAIQRSGVNTVIRAGNNAIINYRSFSIGAGESVRFIQPSAGSRVLNRITGPDPSRIAGSLIANGIVYIVNPAGVYFAHGALVDVGGIYAAAGNITDRDFLNNVNHFTDLRGAVENRGTIDASSAHLVGAAAANYGTINAPNGIVTMSAGGEVYLGEPNGQVFAHVSSGAAGGQTGVTQAGQINAAGGRVRLGAGDMYAMAIDHPGRTTARDITLQGGRSGVVSVSGTLDASNRAAGGVGGTVQVLGDKVGLFGGQIDASGDAGGGVVRLGGDYQGGGTTPRASATYVSETASVRADAVTSGDGGRVIVWSDYFTNYQGSISARGGALGGSGGFVETSGKINLFMAGSVDASAPRGRGGLWLLDPTDVTISTAATDPPGLVGGVFTPDPVATANVQVNDIEAALRGGTSVTINTASAGGGMGDITILDTINPNLNMSNGAVTLTLNAVHDIIMTNGAASISQMGADPLSLVFNAGNAITISRPIAVDGSITMVGPAGIALGSTISPGTDITFTGPVTLMTDLTLAANNITFSSTIDSDGTARTLILNTSGGGVTTLGGSIGMGSALSALTTNADGTTVLDGAEVHAATVAFNDPLTLGVDTAITGTTSVAFGSTVDSETGEGNDLAVNSPLTTFTGNLGAAAGGDLGALATDAAGSTTVSGTVTAGSVALADAVTLAGGTVTTTGAQSYGDLTLNANTMLDGSAVTFGGTVNGDVAGRDLTVNTSGGGATTFNGNVGVIQALGMLTTNADGSTVINAAQVHGATLAFNDAVVLETGSALTGTTSVTFASTVNSAASEANNLTVNSPLTTFTGNVGAAVNGALGDLNTDAPGSTSVAGTIAAASVALADAVTLGGGSVTTSGDQSYGALTLTADTVLAGNDVTFAGTVDSSGGARNLTINSSGGGVTIFNGNVGAGSALATLTTNADGLTRINAAQVTAAVLAFNDPVRIDAPTVLAGTTSIAFASTVDSQFGEANALTLNTPALTFNGNVGNAGGGELGALVSDAAGTATLNAAQFKAATVTFNDALVVGVDSTITGSTSVAFNGTVNSEASEGNDLTISSPLTSFNGLVGGAANGALGLLRTDAPGTTNINTAMVTAGTIDLLDSVVLRVDTTLAGTTSVAFGGTVDSETGEANDLTITSPSASFAAAVGMGAGGALGTFTSSLSGTTMIGGAVNGAVLDFMNAVIVIDDAVVTGTTSVHFFSTVDSESGEGNDLAINSPMTTFTGDVGAAAGGALGALATDAAGTTLVSGTVTAGSVALADAVTLAGGVVTTTGAQSYGNLTLNADTMLDGSAVTFGGTVNGDVAGRDLTVNTSGGGATTFNGNVGVLQALGALTTNADGSTVINAAQVHGATLAFNDAVLLETDTALTGTTSVAFGGTLNSQAAETNDLTINSPLTTFAANVGTAANGALGTLMTDAAGSTTINAPQVVAVVLDFNDDVVIGVDSRLAGTTLVDFAKTLVSESGEANDLALSSASIAFHDVVGSGPGRAFGFFQIETGPGTTLIDTTVVRGARLDFGNAVVVGQDATLTGTQSIVFRSTLNSEAAEANDLTLNAPVTNINGQVGNAAGNTALGLLTTDAAGTTTLNTGVVKAATVNFQDAVVLAFNVAITAPTSITFGSSVDSRAGESRSLTLNSPVTLFSGVVGGAPGGSLGTLTTDAAGTTSIDAGAITAATVNFQDAVALQRDVVINGAGSVSFRAALDSQSGEANDLTITAPVVTFGGIVGAGAGGGLGSLVVTSTGAIHLDGGSVTVASADFRGNTLLGVSNTLTVTSAAIFGGTVDSEAGEANTLTVTGPSATFTGAVGLAANGALGALTVDAATLGSSVTTTGDQTYNGALSISGPVTLTGNDITFASTINSATLADQALVVNTVGNGATTFSGAVGAINPLASLTTNLDGTTRIAGGSITTSGDQIFNDTVVLGADSTLSGNSILFSDTLDSDGTFRALTLNAAGGGTTFAGAVGATSRLANLAVTSATATRINGGSVTTEGAQNYTGPAILGADTTLAASGVTFGGTLNSDSTFRALAVNTTGGGTTTFNGVVGGSSALQSLTTNADGRTQIFGSSIRTIGDQTYNDAVVLGGDVTIQSHDATFASTIDATPLLGPVSLGVTASGVTTFAGAIGAGTPLTSLTTDAAGSTRIGADITTVGGTMTFNDAVRVFGDATLTDTGGTGITFGTTLNSETGNHALALLINTNDQASLADPSIAKISFGGDVGGTLAFSTLTLGGNRSTSPAVATIVAGLNPATNQPIANFALRINTTGAFTMGAGQKFTVIGALTINSGGAATLSDISTLGNLTVNAPSIAIHTRRGGTVLGAIVGAGNNAVLVNDSDSGTDFVAGGQIDFSATPTVLGGFLPPSFATPSATGISATLSNFAQRAFGDVNANIMHAGQTVLDLRSAGPSNANFAEAIAGAAPRESQSGLVTQDTAIGRAQQEELQQLGIFARSPEAQQLLDFLTGRALYNDVPNVPNPVASDYQVTVNRLPAELVDQVLSSYRAVFYKDGQPQPQRPAEVLQKAWEEYAKAAGDKADPLGFRAYVESLPSEAEALYYLDGLRQLFTELGYLGLSPVELKIARQTLLNAVAFPGLTPEQLEAAIMARNLGTASAE